MKTADQKNAISKQVILFAFAAIVGKPLFAEPTYAIYHNTRFAYSIAYPKEILFPQGEADNGDGQVFLSKATDASLRVYGSNYDKNIPDDYPSLADAYREGSRGGISENQTKVVTYKQLKNNWFVISGLINGKIFYQKTIYGKDKTLTLYLEYPKNQQKTYDAITKHIANSLKIAE
ncbi:MAG: hypothetical protein PHU14_14845 [Methylovulum sp.]|nr:hypothetical protein [Methylovulum sp.]